MNIIKKHNEEMKKRVRELFSDGEFEDFLLKNNQKLLESVIEEVEKFIKEENDSGSTNRNCHRVRMCEEIITKLEEE